MGNRDIPENLQITRRVLGKRPSRSFAACNLARHGKVRVAGLSSSAPAIEPEPIARQIGLTVNFPLASVFTVALDTVRLPNR